MGRTNIKRELSAFAGSINAPRITFRSESSLGDNRLMGTYASRKMAVNDPERRVASSDNIRPLTTSKTVWLV